MALHKILPVAAVAIIGLSGCSSAPPAERSTVMSASPTPIAFSTPSTSATPPVNPTFSTNDKEDIIANLSQSNDYQTLTKLIKEAGLETALKGKGPFTFFAPTDAAFAKLPEGALAALSADKKLLAHVLSYHVATGSKTAKLLKPGPVKNLAKYDAAYHVENGEPMINTSRITATDKMASNGVIHVIDAVLLTRKAYDELGAKGIKL